jgi:hypothetical protein
MTSIDFELPVHALNDSSRARTYLHAPDTSRHHPLVVAGRPRDDRFTQTAPTVPNRHKSLIPLGYRQLQELLRRVGANQLLQFSDP